MNNFSIISLFFLGSLFFNKFNAQSPTLIPTSDASIRLMNPNLTGWGYKNRITFNQLIDCHPVDYLHSLIFAYDVDIPKFGLLTGFQYYADRIGTKNFKQSLQLNLGYELNLTKEIKMIFSYNPSFSQQSIDEPTYFNCFDFNDTLNTILSGNSIKNYLQHFSGFVVKTKPFIGGINQKISNENIGQFDGINIISNQHINLFALVNYPQKSGNFKTYFSYSNIKFLGSNSQIINSKFPLQKIYNISVNYESNNNWLTGFGIRIIENQSTMYHIQTGLNFKIFKINYGFGISPYKSLGIISKYAITSQVTMELDLKRRKSYHRPKIKYEYEKFAAKTMKIERILMDDKLVSYTEYFDNGELKINKNFKDDLLDGAYLEGNKEGWEVISGHYKKGLKNGSWNYYNDNGEKIKFEKYKMGELIEKREFKTED